jgi:uridine kinase
MKETKMKIIIIVGVCRTGKSRLANMIFSNTKSTVLHADTLTNFLKNNLPDKFRVDFQLDGMAKTIFCSKLSMNIQETLTPNQGVCTLPVT